MGNDAYRRKLEAINLGIETSHWASLGIHHGASYCKSYSPRYKNNFDDCVFPMQKIKPVPIKNWINESSAI